MVASGPAHDDPRTDADHERDSSPNEPGAAGRPDNGRSCGACTACCTVKAVQELGKPSQVVCRHVCQSGCAVYDARPTECRQYACFWRQGLIDGDERRRPDQLGVIFDCEPFVRMPGMLRLVVWEVVPGAAKSDKVRYLVDKLLAAHQRIKAVAYCAAGQPAHHDFAIDRRAYPGDEAPAALPIVAFDQRRGIATYEFRKAG